jgi:hypothetical protein
MAQLSTRRKYEVHFMLKVAAFAKSFNNCAAALESAVRKRMV